MSPSPAPPNTALTTVPADCAPPGIPACPTPWPGEPKAYLQLHTTATASLPPHQCKPALWQGHGDATVHLGQGPHRVDMAVCAWRPKRWEASLVLLGLAVQGWPKGPVLSEGPDCSAEGFLAPLFQFMPLTGQDGTLGVPVPQLRPSAVDYGYNSWRFSSFLPPQPSTKRRFLPASPLSCVLCDWEITRHYVFPHAYSWKASTWNRD